MTLARCHTNARTHAHKHTHTRTHTHTHARTLCVSAVSAASYRRLKVATSVLVERLVVRTNTHDSTDCCCVLPISLFSTRLDVTQRREIGGVQQHTDIAQSRTGKKPWGKMWEGVRVDCEHA